MNKNKKKKKKKKKKKNYLPLGPGSVDADSSELVPTSNMSPPPSGASGAST